MQPLRAIDLHHRPRAPLLGLRERPSCPEIAEIIHFCAATHQTPVPLTATARATSRGDWS